MVHLISIFSLKRPIFEEWLIIINVEVKIQHQLTCIERSHTNLIDVVYTLVLVNSPPCWC